MIYILGTGYVAKAYSKYFLINSIPHKLISRKEVPYNEFMGLSTFLHKNKPSLLINASGFLGYGSIDDCEIYKLPCLYSNTTLPGIIGAVCSSLNIPWIHVSDGCIYDGSKRERNIRIRPIDEMYSPLMKVNDTLKTNTVIDDVVKSEFSYTAYTEEDVPNFGFRDQFSSFYSGSKAMGEELLNNSSTTYICRLKMPFNNQSTHRNYLRKLATHEKLLSVSNSISQIDEFVKATYTLFEKQAPFGTYNVTNPGVVESSIVVKKLIDAGIRKLPATWVDTAEFNTIVKSPRSNCILNSTKVGNFITLTDVNEAIDIAIKKWEE